MKTAILLIALLAIYGCETQTQQISVKQPNTTTRTLSEYYSQIDYGCRTDSDCEIKNIGNCCGYYPQCTNKQTKADLTELKELCQGIVSTCGFPTIDSCRCSAGRCEGFKKT